jgi:RNA polymerase sigma-70 factor, ECF subfamily
MPDAVPTDVERLNPRVLDAEVALEMDEEAFALFYQRTARALWTYLCRVSRDRQLADDLLQETYYRYLKCRRTFESEAHRRYYLFKIATNLVLDGRRRPRERFVALPAETDATIPTASDGGEQMVRRAALAVAMGRLTPRERGLLWLAYAQGASHDEIAASTGLKVSSIKPLLFRARRRLATLLGISAMTRSAR